MQKTIAVLLTLLFMLSFVPTSFATDEDAVLDAYATFVSGDYEKTISKLGQLTEERNAFAGTLLCFECITQGEFASAYLEQHDRTEFIELLEWMKELYAQGDLAAGMVLGFAYLHGIGVSASEETARSYFDPTEETLIELAEQSATKNTGITFSNFGDRAENIGTGNSVKNPLICYYIGICYEVGVRGVDKDPERAMLWYQEGMRYGFPEALYRCTELVLTGSVEGTLSECRSGLELLAARYSYNLAAYRLAVLEFYQGNYKEGQEMLQLAADLGNERAMLTNGGIVFDGELADQFDRLIRNEQVHIAKETGAPPIHQAKMGDRDIFVIMFDEGNIEAEITEGLDLCVDTDGFGRDADLAVFRFRNPIENCVYFAASVRITGDDDFDFSDVEWVSAVHQEGKDDWDYGNEYEYEDGIWTQAAFGSPEPVTLDAFSVVPGVAPNGYGPFGINADFGETVIGFPNEESAQAFIDRFAYEAEEIPQAVLDARDAVVHVYLLFYDENDNLLAYSSAAGCIGAGMEFDELSEANWKYVITPWSAVYPYSASFEFDHYVIEVHADGETYEAEGISRHKGNNHDLGIVYLKEKIPDRGFVKFSNNGAEEGETVYALGFPESTDLSVPPGESYPEEERILRSTVLKSGEEESGLNYIVTSQNMDRNMAGGLLVNSKGEMLGMCLYKEAQDGSGTCVIRCEDLAEILTEVGLPTGWANNPAEISG